MCNVQAKSDFNCNSRFTVDEKEGGEKRNFEALSSS